MTDSREATSTPFYLVHGGVSACRGDRLVALRPTAIGGSTRYVVTSGVSMEPRFHTGDLALVRPAGQYKVGDIVAYCSTLLRTVVLHRIHAIDGNTYVFKGDNNDFLDPVHPTRAELLGKLWLHIPGGGSGSTPSTLRSSRQSCAASCGGTAVWVRRTGSPAQASPTWCTRISSSHEPSS